MELGGNAAAIERLLKYLAGDPKLIYHFSMEALTNPHFSENFSQLTRLLTDHEDYLKVISYLGRSGRAGLPTLNKTIDLIAKGGITDSGLVAQILTDGPLRAVLRQLDDPADMKGLWDEFLKEKPSSSFVDFAKNKAKIRGNIDIKSKYKNFDKLTIYNKNLTLLGDTESALMEAIKAGRLLPENKALQKALQKALDELLNSDLIGTTSNLKAARGKVIKKLNQTLGENIQNADEFVEVMKEVKQTASQGSIGEHWAVKMNFLSGKGKRFVHPTVKLKQLDQFPDKTVIPDQLRLTPNRTLDVKVGYLNNPIDEDQMKIYADLVKYSKSDHAVKKLLQEIGVPEGRLMGHDYLFLPGAEGKAIEAAKQTYNTIKSNGFERYITVHYLDQEGMIKIYPPN